MTLDVGVLRPAALLVPIVFAAAAALVATATPRLRGAALLATLWSFAVLLAVNAVAVHAGWWIFGTDGAEWASVPVDVILGWSVLWGAVPVLVSPWVSPALVAAVLVVSDVVAMPALAPLVVLHDRWWLGEIAVVTTGLIPAVVLGILTARARALRVRATLQVVLFTALLFFLLPTAVFAAAGSSWSDRLQRLGGPVDLIVLQLGLIVGIVALRAVTEFARHGGTPFPWDPPATLVRSGPYAYVANPMQISASILLLLTSIALADAWFAAAVVVAIAFSAGVAEWNERDHLRQRFGDEWVAYRREVHDWLPRRRPTALRPEATLYPEYDCDPCSQVGGWFVDRRRVQLLVSAAEQHPEPLRRIRYESDGVREDGTRAIGAALEHVNIGWALVGWGMRAPVVGWLVQLVADAMGAGPRKVEAP